MSNGNGHHYSKFCWRDWSADKALHPCSLGAKGFWIEMLCIMHEGTPVGHLTLGGKAATIRQMAANAYCTEKEAKKYLAELEESGVFSRTDDGTIYSRRMVKDAALSEAGREHIAKRWNGAKPAHPPNSPPNRGPMPEPTREPTSQAYRPPGRDPITNSQKLEVQSEQEKEKKESKLNNLPFNSPVLARAERLPDGLDAVLSDAGVTPPKPGTVGAEVVQMHVKRTAKAMEMRIPYGEVRSAEAQIEALKEHPKAAGAEATMGLKWQPAEPVRTPAEQLVALLGISHTDAEQRLRHAS